MITASVGGGQNAPTCIRCRGALDQWGEHLVGCKLSTNPEFAKRESGSHHATSTRAPQLRSYRRTHNPIPDQRDRFEAVREAA